MICESFDCSLSGLSIFMGAVSTPFLQYFLQNCKSSHVMLEVFDRMRTKWKRALLFSVSLSHVSMIGDLNFLKLETY